MRRDDGVRGDLTISSGIRINHYCHLKKLHRSASDHVHRRILNSILWLHRRSAPALWHYSYHSNAKQREATRTLLSWIVPLSVTSRAANQSA